MKEDYEFEWDEVKNTANRKKHGLSFDEAKAIWDDPAYLAIQATTEPEERWVVIGHTAKNTYLTAAITYRDERIRIISARKSSKKEIDAYVNN